MRLRRLSTLAVCMFAALMPAASGGADDVCRGVTCGGHGVCMAERNEPFCFCEDGFAAVELTCAPAVTPDDSARRRSSTVGGQVVYFATAEAERGPRFVGTTTRGVTPLRDVVEPGEMWCSDFVSWVYQRAGVPFTGGYRGGWHLTNNVAIQRWFERRGLWVARGSAAWDTFEPMPGDYFQMSTESGNGHSGIVRYTRGDVLYSVEGNVGNRVRERRWGNFRRHRRFTGFGILTRPSERAPRSPSPSAEAPR